MLNIRRHDVITQCVGYLNFVTLNIRRHDVITQSVGYLNFMTLNIRRIGVITEKFVPHYLFCIYIYIIFGGLRSKLVTDNDIIVG